MQKYKIAYLLLKVRYVRKYEIFPQKNIVDV